MVMDSIFSDIYLAVKFLIYLAKIGGDAIMLEARTRIYDPQPKTLSTNINSYKLLKDKDIRIIKQKKESEFTTIYNDCINDKKLSIGGLAILVYIMSKPSNWNIMISDIRKRFNIGRDKAYGIISELCVYGYMKRYTELSEDGTISKWIIMASDKPIFIDSQEDDKHPDPDFQEVDPDPDFQEVDAKDKKSSQVIVNINKNQKNNKKHPDPDFQEVDPYIQKKDFLISKEKTYCAKKTFEKNFEEFWNEYDNKKAKQKCQKAYANLIRDKGVDLHGIIMNALSEQKRERVTADALGIWQPARKMPLTWLNGHCWEDEVKTEEQLNAERQRIVRNLSKKPRGISAIDEYHNLNVRVREAADREISRINEKLRTEFGEDAITDDEAGIEDF